jgi:hypothetical protein
MIKNSFKRGLAPILGLAATAMIAGFASSTVFALEITTSAGCGTVGSSTTCEPDSADDNYGYSFVIDDQGGTSATYGTTIYQATLTNTSPATSIALIDGLAFNVDPDLVLGTDFFIQNIDPTSWTFAAGSGAVLFDYVGERGTPADRLSSGGSLTFDFVFTSSAVTQILTEYPTGTLFDWWTQSEATAGAGFGGGGDVGQVAVSFQQLASIEDGPGQGSDLLASYWGPSPGPGPGPGPGVPVPAPLALFGLGGLMLGWTMKRKRA